MAKTPLVTEITDDFDDFGLLGDDLDAASFADDIKEFDTALSGSRGGPRYAEDWDDFSQPAPTTTWGGAKAYAGKPATTWGGAKGFGKSTGYRSSYYGGWGGSYTSGYARTSYSSWYSGYSSTATAMRGVHRSASSFVRDVSIKSLAIYPSSNESISFETIERRAKSDNLPASGRGLHVRIDASLYEQLGIEKAQQHYTLDAIAQVLALQALPDANVVRDLQNLQDFPFPRLVREVITEVVRRRGLELLSAEMPGWLNRVTAFKDAMVMQPGASPTGATPGGPHEQLARFRLLMHAVWLPSVPLGDPIFPEALAVVSSIDAALEDPKSKSHAELARDITNFVANSSGIGMLATTIETMVQILDIEYERTSPMLPEPPVTDEARDALVAGFSALRKGINAYFQVESPDDSLFPADKDWTCEALPGVDGARLLKRAKSVRSVADRAALNAYRGIGHEQPEIFQAIDQLTALLAHQRQAQGNLDRHCDRTRTAYETQLRSALPLDDGLSHRPVELFKTSNLSIVWAHATANPEFMPLEIRSDRLETLSDAAHAEVVLLRDSLQEKRNEYRKLTTELIKTAQEADATEGRLCKAIERLPDEGHEVHLRFASGGLADARVRLADLLNDLLKQENDGGGDKLFCPSRPGEGEGNGGSGNADDLKVDSGEVQSDGTGKDKRGGELVQNHDDLIVDADVCSEDLPHIGTDKDLPAAPDILIFDATDPSITTEVFS
jgi:hypothetical protein